MTRWLASAGILALLLLALGLPVTGLGRRGTDAEHRLDAVPAGVAVGQRMPELGLVGFDGEPVRLADLRGRRVLLTFERSVDW